MTHKQTHPEISVPQYVKDAFPEDISYQNDECPSFLSLERKEVIYWSNEGFSIWRTDDEGALTEPQELFQGLGEDCLNLWVNSPPTPEEI